MPVPKYRHKAFFGGLRERIGGILRALCWQKELELLEGHAMPDHVHMRLSVPPRCSITMTIEYPKGKNAIRFHREISGTKGILFGRRFWARGYGVSTVGRNEGQIREYIRNQEKGDREYEQSEIKFNR